MKAERLLHEAFWRRGESAETQARPALVADGRRYTYGELLESARRLATALHERDLRRGDRVVIALENSWACVVSIYATLIAGGVIVLVHPQTRAEKLAFILRDSGARMLIAEGRHGAATADALARLDARPTMLATEPTGADPSASF